VSTVLEQGQGRCVLPGGYLTFTSGENSGGTVEVMEWDADTGTVTLLMGALYPIAAGDGVLIAPGCDKTFGTCRDVFNNAVNFRGEPFLAGSDALTAYPGRTTGSSGDGDA